MTGVLIIGPAEQAEIDAALVLARAKPTPWSVFEKIVNDKSVSILKLKDRKPGVNDVRAEYPPQHVQLGTYRVALSFEEQPAGIFKHISVSSERKGKVPGPEVMQMVLEAFGFSLLLCQAVGTRGEMLIDPKQPCRVWMEEFDPGHIAINVVELENALQ